MDRREFLTGAAGAGCIIALGGGTKLLFSGEGANNTGTSNLLRPPGGQSESNFIGACIRCDRCRTACPNDCIRLGALEDGLINVRTPYLDFTRGYCNLCDGEGVNTDTNAPSTSAAKCINVCPTSALGGAFAKIGVAIVDADVCVNCEKCVSACSPGAITWDSSTALPVVDSTKCWGCGACEFICPSDSYGYYSAGSKRAIYVSTTWVQAASYTAE